jgi:hypothetical protein
MEAEDHATFPDGASQAVPGLGGLRVSIDDASAADGEVNASVDAGVTGDVADGGAELMLVVGQPAGGIKPSSWVAGLPAV